MNSVALFRVLKEQTVMGIEEAREVLELWQGTEKLRAEASLLTPVVEEPSTRESHNAGFFHV